MPQEPPGDPYLSLPAFDEESDDLNAIVDTPKHSRNKYEYDEKLRLFKLSGVLPAGAYFPYDFGYVPSTLGEDGDPLDVLILMDEPAFVGCLVPARLIGVIEAEQTERDGDTGRNDRLIAVAANSHAQKDVRSLEDVSGTTVDEIEHFFVSYNEVKSKRFKPLGRFGPDRARQAVERGIQQALRSRQD
ncbi:MAG: inorganic diphosphatase [Chloroflexota bacterium]|nr:inorganic diphosphatase [Chloroflexota bacterium]